MTENRTEHVVIRQLDSSEAGFAAALREVLAFEASEDEAIDRAAAQIRPT